MEDVTGDLTFQYKQNVGNLLFIVKNIIKTYEEDTQEKNISMYMPHLKEYYEEVVASQEKIKDFRRKIEEYTY